jgi:hypothetical protein
MFKYLKKYFPLFLLAIYLSSTMGLVISHIHCFCEDQKEVKLFSVNCGACSLCEQTEEPEPVSSCCTESAHKKDIHDDCCENEVVLLKIIADYKTSSTVTITELLTFISGNVIFINSDVELLKTNFKYTFLNDDIPKISGKEMVTYLHQFKIDHPKIG